MEQDVVVAYGHLHLVKLRGLTQLAFYGSGVPQRFLDALSRFDQTHKRLVFGFDLIRIAATIVKVL